MRHSSVGSVLSMTKRPPDTLRFAASTGGGTPCARRSLNVGHAMKFANLLPPVFVCLIMSTIWSVHMGFHLLPLLQVELPLHLRSVEDFHSGIVQMVISQVLVFKVLLCYARAMTTLPGSVPDTMEWKLIGGHEVDGLQALTPLTKEVKVTGERRHCKWCLRYKPDRCHHCRVCDTCVLRMDHHCPWIVNCVGFRNHKYFFLLVLYSVAACMFIGATLLGTVRRSVEKEMTVTNRFILVLGFMLTIIMGTLMTFFFAFHFHLMLSGMTTIEYCEKSTMASTGLAYKRQSYDRGFHRNLAAVLGPRPLFWLLPIFPPEGDGTHFQEHWKEQDSWKEWGADEAADKVDPEWTSVRGPGARL